MGFLIASSNNFNPVTNFTEGNTTSGAIVYDRLLTSWPDQRRYVLEAAESIEVSDPMKVVFKLKPGLVYQNLPPVNGRAVRADDIATTQNFIKDNPRAFDRGFQTTFVDRMEAPDDRTVIYHLKTPSAYLFSNTQLGSGPSQPIIPKELLDNLDTNHPVGSGPYFLAEFQMNTRYLYKKNPTYRDASKGLPYIDEREVLAITDPVAMETAFRGNQIHLWTHSLASQRRLVSELGDRAVLEQAPGLAPAPLHLNMKRDNLPWRRDARVREAFYRGTNRQQLLDLVYGGLGVLQPGAIPAGLEAWQVQANETAQYYKYDPAEAKRLLDAAGWNYNQEYECVEQINAVKIQLAEAWSNQMNSLGVKIRVSSVPFAEWLPNRIGRGEYDLTIDPSPSDDTPGKSIRLHHSDQRSLLGGFGLQDPAIDALIDKSETTVDLQENIRLVKQIQIEVLKKYSSTFNFFTFDYAILRSPKLMDYEVNPVTGPHARPEMWLDA